MQVSSGIFVTILLMYGVNVSYTRVQRNELIYWNQYGNNSYIIHVLIILPSDIQPLLINIDVCLTNMNTRGFVHKTPPPRKTKHNKTIIEKKWPELWHV